MRLTRLLPEHAAAAASGSGGGKLAQPGRKRQHRSVVAIGKVYVASYQELDIFRIKDEKQPLAVDRKTALGAATKPESPSGPGEHRLYGTERKGQGDQFTIETLRSQDGRTQLNQGACRRALCAGCDWKWCECGGIVRQERSVAAESVHRVQRHPSTWPEDR
jgi:hypothetical protein